MGFVFFLNILFLKTVKKTFKTWKIKKNVHNLNFKNNYILRWWYLNLEEKKKNIFFEIVKNDGFKKNTEILSQLKNLFSKQLPNMPFFYINQIVLDSKQESIALIKYKNMKPQLIGGCSYIIFKKQQLIELVFFAIVTSEQTKGYGKILMSFFKEKAASSNIKSIVTCADNNAIKYFHKQGFSEIITSPIFTWAGHLSDYEEIKLMECSLFNMFKYYNDITYVVIQKSLVGYKSRLIKEEKNQFMYLRKKINLIKKEIKKQNNIWISRIFFNFSSFSKKKKKICYIKGFKFYFKYNKKQLHSKCFFGTCKPEKKRSNRLF